MQFDWQQVKNLLVVIVGDTDITSLQAALHRIREALTYAEIALLSCEREDATFITGINRIIPYTTDWQNAAREKELVEQLQRSLFDAAIIFTDCLSSPYPIAYLCYLAGIPIRVSQSREFGGSVLSDWIKPPLNDLSQSDRHLYLLNAITFPVVQPSVAIAQH